MYKKWTILLLALILCFTLAAPLTAADDVGKGALTVGEIMNCIHNYHIEGPTVNELTVNAIDGMLFYLDDPYTEYIGPEFMESFQESLSGDFVGVGIQLEEGKTHPLVVDVISGSPAAGAGLRGGDILLQVDGRDVKGWNVNNVVERIRGPEGTTVKLRVQREGAGELDFTVNRAALHMPTVEYRSLENNIGYIYVRSFGSNTANEFKKALEELLGTGVKGLVLDLRNDPGGYLQAAVDIASNFLPAGESVVTTVEKDGRQKVYRTAGGAIAHNLPLAVLVNGLSASSSEVLAGALQDHGVATLVGSSTYGKGVVQSIIPLSNGGALKLTTAHYTTPKGRIINNKGLIPDRYVQTEGLQVIAASRVLLPDLPRSVRYAVNSLEVLVDGQRLSNQLSPFRSEGKVFFPLKLTLEALGYQVLWDEGIKKIRVFDGNDTILLPLAGPQADVNGSVTVLPSPLTMHGTISYISLDSLLKLGIRVDADGDEFVLTK